ncbi:MAG: D-alanine--D-alanine ligase, partial [Ignavibacteriaceae bacterium]
IRAFRSLRCEVYGRVDFRLNDENFPFCLEVNTLPGMTETSLVPKMAYAVGLSFEELIDRIIRNSLDGQN